MTTKAKKVQTGILYVAGGDKYLVRPENGTEFDYRELQKAVGGLIETIVPKRKRSIVFANEEGLLISLPPNQHTPEVADMDIYLLNGYGRSWRIAGNVIEYHNDDPSVNANLPTIAEALREHERRTKPDIAQNPAGRQHIIERMLEE